MREKKSGMGDIFGEHLQIKNLFIFPLTLHTAEQICSFAHILCLSRSYMCCVCVRSLSSPLNLVVGKVLFVCVCVCVCDFRLFHFMFSFVIYEHWKKNPFNKTLNNDCSRLFPSSSSLSFSSVLHSQLVFSGAFIYPHWFRLNSMG